MTKRVHLKFAGLQRRTISAYHLALQRFLAFVKEKPCHLRSTKDLDAALAEYLNCMFQEGEPVSAAGHALSGIKRFLPDVRLKLSISSQYLRNWQRCHRPVRAVPISWELLQALASIAWSQGAPNVALLLYIGFNCFLRTAEMLSLQFCHLMPHARKPEVAVVIPFAKTSNGNAQVLLVHDYNIWLLSKALLTKEPSTALLWAGTPHQFRKLWASLLSVLDFACDDYSPYGVRRGGATWYFLETGSLDATLARGRWAISKVAKQYIDDGTLTLAKMQWTKTQKRLVRHWLRVSKSNFLKLKAKGLLSRAPSAGNKRWKCARCFVFGVFLILLCFSFHALKIWNCGRLLSLSGVAS